MKSGFFLQKGHIGTKTEINGIALQYSTGRKNETKNVVLTEVKMILNVI